jgi:hypothetical protein
MAIREKSLSSFDIYIFFFNKEGEREKERERDRPDKKAKWGLVNESQNCSLFFSTFGLVRYRKKKEVHGFKKP